MRSVSCLDLISTCEVGDELKIQIYRQGETKEVTVVVEEKVQSALEEEAPQQSSQSRQQIFPGFPWGDFFG